MPNGTYGGVRGRKTKEVGGKTSKILCFPPTRFLHPGVCICICRFDFFIFTKVFALQADTADGRTLLWSVRKVGNLSFLASA